MQNLQSLGLFSLGNLWRLVKLINIFVVTFVKLGISKSFYFLAEAEAKVAIKGEVANEVEVG